MAAHKGTAILKLEDRVNSKEPAYILFDYLGLVDFGYFEADFRHLLDKCINFLR